MENQFTSHYPEERRLATILFADIKGFTALSDALDYEVVSELLNKIWFSLDQVIENHGGYIDKHMGDGVMAVWGAPNAAEDDAERAVMTALKMHKLFNSIVKNSSTPGVRNLRLRVGINTGNVLATHVGVHNEYTVIGDAVNVASRLEGKAKPGTVIISESTYRMVRGAFRIRRISPLSLKGKTDHVPAYVVNRILPHPSRIRYRDMGGLKTCMVAREREMERVYRYYREVQDNLYPKMVLVVGEAGLGKSRFLMEFTKMLELDEPSLTMMSSRGLAQAGGSPFYLWKSLWQNQFNLRENDPPSVTRERFLRELQTLWGEPKGTANAVAASHLIGNLIGIDWPNSPHLAGMGESPMEKTIRAFEVLRDLLGRVCQTGPLILVLDDLQWVDQSSLELVKYLLKPGSQSFPFFILGSARPELLSKDIDWANLTEVINLEPLPLNSDLVAKAYPDLISMSDELRSQLAKRSGGNPYFLEEMVKGYWRIHPSATDILEMNKVNQFDYELPDSLQSLLQARLDQLTEETRMVALVASVMGRVFWIGALKEAVAQQPLESGFLNYPKNVLDRVIQNSLRELIRSELAFPRAGSVFAGEKEYIFKHTLLREVAYNLLPIKNRKIFHRAIANWLKIRSGQDLKAMIADHYEKAGDLDEAVHFYNEALNYSQTRGAEEETAWLLSQIRRLEMTRE